jgi:ribosomal protein L13E
MAVAEESARLRRCVAPIVDCICKMRVEGLADNQLVLEQVIAELQKIEQSVERKTLFNLKIRMALRFCLKELRKLSLTARLAERIGSRVSCRRRQTPQLAE